VSVIPAGERYCGAIVGDGNMAIAQVRILALAGFFFEEIASGKGYAVLLGQLVTQRFALQISKGTQRRGLGW